MIHRAEHEKEYTVITNEIIEDDRLSDGAFRLLVFMLSCADGWKFSLRGLAYCFNVSERTISDRLAELKRAGYVQIKWPTDQHGRFQASEWEVFESPQPVEKNNRVEEKPQRGSTATRNHRNAVPPQRGFASTLKQIPIKTNTKYKQIRMGATFKKPTLEEVQNYCQERGNRVNAQAFLDHYEANGWKVGKAPMKDWKATVRNWERNEYGTPKRSGRKKWRTGAEAGIESGNPPAVSQIRKNEEQIPGDILDLFGN